MFSSRLLGSVLLISLLSTTQASAGEDKTKKTPQAANTSQVNYRVYPHSIEASSYLWNELNRFQENFHPNYLFDDSPETAWLEGAPSTSAKKQLTFRMNYLSTKDLRIRILGGFQKNQETFAKYARPKSLKVTMLPSNTSQTLKLADTQDPQEFTLSQGTNELLEIEIEVLEVYLGNTNEPLAISDIQLFAAVPAEEQQAWQEQNNIQTILDWKKSRTTIAKTWKDGVLPLAPIYESTFENSIETVVQKQDIPKNQEAWDGYYSVVHSLNMLRKKSPEKTAHLDMLEAMLKHSDWKPVTAKLSKTVLLPEHISGVNHGYIRYDDEGMPVPSLSIPTFQKSLLVQNSILTLQKSSLKKNFSRDYTPCKKEGQTQLWSSAILGKASKAPQEILLEVCEEDPESREGTTYSMTPYYLVYDEQGRLSLVVHKLPFSSDLAVQSFSWSQDNPTILTEALSVQTRFEGDVEANVGYKTTLHRIYAPSFTIQSPQKKQ